MAKVTPNVPLVKCFRVPRGGVPPLRFFPSWTNYSSWRNSPASAAILNRSLCGLAASNRGGNTERMCRWHRHMRRDVSTIAPIVGTSQLCERPSRAGERLVNGCRDAPFARLQARPEIRRPIGLVLEADARSGSSPRLATGLPPSPRSHDNRARNHEEVGEGLAAEQLFLTDPRVTVPSPFPARGRARQPSVLVLGQGKVQQRLQTMAC